MECKENYTAEEVNKTAFYVFEILKSRWPVMFSWGYSQGAAVVFRGMKALCFHVHGFLHKGYVIVALNEGMDAFEVYKLDENCRVLSCEQTIVYADMLVDVIDRMVEKDVDDEEYIRRVDAFRAGVYR